MRELIVNKNDENQRLDKFLQKALPLLPSTLMYKYIRLKRIKVNGKKCEISRKLKLGDVISLYINDEFFDTKEEEYFYKAPQDIQIVYEDKNILIVNKPAELIVHEDDKERVDTLINRIKRYLYEKGEFDPKLENSFSPALCNRIDRNTEGLVIAAKNAEALKIMCEKIKKREIDKYYMCIVFGSMPKKSDTLTAYLTKDSDKNQVKISDKKGEKTIKTKYTVLMEKENLSLLEIKLITGRTHQIRAHMAYMGHPLLGDTKYGRASDNRNYPFRFQALCSYKLVFNFQSDAGILNYLSSKTIELKNISFKQEFFDLL